MRARFLSCALLITATAAAAAAQQFTRVWLRVAPEGEEFAVHMPEPNFRIRRELPFGGAVLKPVSYEVPYGGAVYSVLSFSKSEPKAPQSLNAFVKGFQRALAQGSGGAVTGVKSEGELKLDGHAGSRLRLEGVQGSASVFETGSHFYVVMTYGGADAGAAEHFQNSFTLARDGADRIPLSDTAQAPGSPAKPPAPLWPFAYGTNLIVAVRDSKADGAGLPDVDASKAGGGKVISGGVINGKALAKPQPVYPPIAKAARVQGAVTVQLLVDEEGYVIAAEAVSGHPLLQRAGAHAARQARSTPTLLEGRPVKVSGLITYNFVLQ